MWVRPRIGKLERFAFSGWHGGRPLPRAEVPPSSSSAGKTNTNPLYR
jgi:hypothetical protein